MSRKGQIGIQKSLAVVAVVSAMATAACTHVPSGVISPDDMASLLADIHTAESVVEMNYSEYASDSARKALRQAVLAKHGVDRATFDTSLVWYGSHLKEYREIYDETEKILQKRIDKSDAVASAATQVYVSGDSVDVWSRSRRYIYMPGASTNVLTFNIKADSNSKNGDSYTWRGKFMNNSFGGYWSVAASYSDGSTDILQGQFGGDGWQSITFYTDSTRVLRNIYGTLEILRPAEGSLYLDSLQLIRKRVDPYTYVQRYRQRHYDFILDKK